MKQNYNYCKIVYDLLPNYIENLTQEETNAFIQKHIAKCDICAKQLEHMSNSIDEDQIEPFNQVEEINYLKKIRRKIKLYIIITSIIIIFINSCVVWYICKMIV